MVSADEEPLRQAFINIVQNAVQAMPGAARSVSAPAPRVSSRWRVTVTDQGVGIAPEDIDKIFKLYYTSKPGGSGIGLSVVHRIVQLHDGIIEAKSAARAGHRVIVRLPVALMRRARSAGFRSRRDARRLRQRGRLVPCPRRPAPPRAAIAGTHRARGAVDPAVKSRRPLLRPEPNPAPAATAPARPPRRAPPAPHARCPRRLLREPPRFPGRRASRSGWARRPAPEDEQRIKARRSAASRGAREAGAEDVHLVRLVREQRENDSTIQSFLAKAREALSTRDVQRAFTLADKAYPARRRALEGPALRACKAYPAR